MIFDSHVHLPSEGWDGHKPWIRTVARAVAELKATGADAVLFNMWQGVFAETERDLEEANAEALALADTHAGFLFPGACLHPAFPAVSLAWLARFRERGFRWVGELVPYRKPYRYLDPAFLELAAECERQGHVLQLHGHGDIPILASYFPRLPVVCSHISVDLLPRLAEQPNVWLDISGGAGGLQLGCIEQARDVLGADRLLYGTDFTGYDPRCFQTRLRAAVPDAEERERIFSGNLLRLLEQAGSRRPPREITHG
jgi:predicted TIM-barrel fold metal-dependent hydrolase